MDNIKSPSHSTLHPTSNKKQQLRHTLARLPNSFSFSFLISSPIPVDHTSPSILTLCRSAQRLATNTGNHSSLTITQAIHPSIRQSDQMAHNALYFRLLTPPHSPNQPSQHVNSRPHRPNRRQRPPPLRIIAPRPRLNVTNRQNEQTNETIPTYAHPLPPDHLLNNHNNHLPPEPLHQLRKSKSNDSLEKAYQEKPALLIRPPSRHKWDDARNLCTICYDILCISPTCNKQHIRQLPCGHRFHEHCIYGPGQWMPKRNTCPLCRQTAFHLILPGKLLTIVTDSLMNNRNREQ